MNEPAPRSGMASELAPIDEEELRRRLPKRKLGLVPWILLASVVFIGTPLIGVYSWWLVAQQQVEDALAAIKEDGGPVTAADVERLYAYPPAGRDATRLWIDAMKVFQTQAFQHRAEPLPIVGQGPDPQPPGRAWEQMKDVESLLAKYAREMDVLHEAASMGGEARYNVKFEEGFVAILPHAQELRTVCRMLCLESYVHAHQGDAHRAAESIHAGLLAAMSLENEPIPVSQVICAAYIRLMTDALQELLPNTDFSDADLTMLQDTVRKYDARRSLLRGLQGARALAIITFQEPAAADQFAEFDHQQKWLLSALGERREDLARYLELMDKVMAAVERPWPEAIASASSVSDEAELISEANLVDHLRYALTSSSFTAHDKFFESLAETEARLRVTDTVLAAARHRKQYGRLPSQANDIVPEFLDEIPQDSFSEGPLRLVFDEDQFTVYSIGSNLRDDGGSNGHVADQELDIVMRLVP